MDKKRGKRFFCASCIRRDNGNREMGKNAVLYWINIQRDVDEGNYRTVFV